MTREEIAAVVEMAWEDIRALDTEGTAIGLAIIVMHRNGNTLDTQLCATTPPEVTRFTISQLVRHWQKRGSRFEVFDLTRRKAV
jgi:hypothetical protein